MFGNWKAKLEQKKAKNKAIGESQRWKNNALLTDCLQVLRGYCTVAPMELHEAAIAVVNIALAENTWTRAATVPADFLEQTVYIVWNDPFLPVLKAERDLVLEQLENVTAVAAQTFLVSDTMDRIIRLDNGENIQFYSVAP